MDDSESSKEGSIVVEMDTSNSGILRKRLAETIGMLAGIPHFKKPRVDAEEVDDTVDMTEL